MVNILAERLESAKPFDKEQFRIGHSKLYIETYGCQMNVADSEVVVSILNKQGFALSEDYKEADLILVNTCSIRDNAEQTAYF